MLLAIDSGNTNIVFALFDGDRIVATWRSWTNAKRTADEYGVWLVQAMIAQNIDVRKIHAAIVCNVVPDMQHILVEACKKYFLVEPMDVTDKRIDYGVTPLVDNPDDVGADRLVNAAGAKLMMPGPFVVIDFGTATVFDVIDEAGNFVGGVIAPGVNTAMDGLRQAAARLPRVALQKPKKVVGKATVPAIQSGLFWGTVAMVEGMILRIEEETDAEMSVIATGGLCQLFADATEIITHVEPHLTLKGLFSIHQRNFKAPIIEKK